MRAPYMEPEQNSKNSSINQQQSTTAIEKFVPTENHIKWLSTAIELKSGNKEEIAKACGIDRASWYRWRKNPQFLEWFYKEWNLAIREWASELDTEGMKEATSKDSKEKYRFWEAMQKRVGNLEDTNNTQVNIDNSEKVINVHPSLLSKYGQPDNI